MVYREGQPSHSFFIVVSGVVVLSSTRLAEEQVLANPNPNPNPSPSPNLNPSPSPSPSPSPNPYPNPNPNPNSNPNPVPNPNPNPNPVPNRNQVAQQRLIECVDELQQQFATEARE